MAVHNPPPPAAGGRRWAPDLAGMLTRIRAARRRWYLGLLLSAALGLIVGLLLAGIEKLINDDMLGPLRRAPLGVQVVAPALGLLAISVVLRVLARGASPFVSDEYMKAYHDPAHPIDLRPVPARVVTGVLTLGSGAAMGAEALGIYLGCVVSTIFSRRFKSLLAGDNARIFLVAGAAAGVSAVFKAPATGAVFALEVPYMQDMAGGAVLPALVGAAVAYLAVALTQGTEPILAVGAGPSFGVPELAGALIVGAACGLGARVFVKVMSSGKHFALGHGVLARVALAGGSLGALVAVTRHQYHQPFTLGAGYDVITWATDPHRGLWLVAALFVLRLLATGATQWGGGTGGSFVPLVVQGALLGRLVQGGLESAGMSSAGGAGSLFVLVGMAAFLSAGYRVPLAAVMFVAESTGKPGFIVPGLLACAVAELVMGRRSSSPYQQLMRRGHVERRFEILVTEVMRTGVHTVGPEATIDDLLQVHLPVARARTLPVVASDGTYLGVVRLRDVERVPRAERATTPVSVLLATPPTADPHWPLRRALETMQDDDLQRLAVVDDSCTFLGILTLSDIAALDDLVGHHVEPSAPPAAAGAGSGSGGVFTSAPATPALPDAPSVAPPTAGTPVVARVGSDELVAADGPITDEVLEAGDDELGAGDDEDVATPRHSGASPSRLGRRRGARRSALRRRP